MAFTNRWGAIACHLKVPLTHSKAQARVAPLGIAFWLAFRFSERVFCFREAKAGIHWAFLSFQRPSQSQLPGTHDQSGERAASKRGKRVPFSGQQPREAKCLAWVHRAGTRIQVLTTIPGVRTTLHCLSVGIAISV